MATKKAAKTVKKPAKKSPKKATKAGAKKPEELEVLSGTTTEIEVASTTPTAGIVDPIGDTTDGEGGVFLTDETTAQEVSEGGADAEIDQAEDREDAESDFIPKARPPAKLDRLQKILSQAGVASRRASEQLMLEGRVTVNGRTVRELGTKADPAADDIRVDGRRIKIAATHRYILLNKPRGYVTTRSDPQQRPTVLDLIAGVREYVYPVGRLDFDSEGLLLLTNDGDLAARLTHPRHGVPRVYEAKVLGVPDDHDLKRLSSGVVVDERRTAPAEVQLLPSRSGANATLRITIREGRNRQIRRMCDAIGHPVDHLKRIAIGPIRDARLKVGSWRDLTPDEVRRLRGDSSARA